MDKTETQIIELVKEEMGVMPVMGITEIIAAALSICDKLLDKTPNYTQKKKEKYYAIKKAYYEELTHANRDDSRVDNLRDELIMFIDAFSKEL